MEYKWLIVQRNNNRSTRYKISFSDKDSLKTLPIPNGTHTQPGLLSPITLFKKSSSREGKLTFKGWGYVYKSIHLCNHHPVLYI